MALVRAGSAFWSEKGAAWGFSILRQRAFAATGSAFQVDLCSLAGHSLRRRCSHVQGEILNSTAVNHAHSRSKLHFPNLAATSLRLI
jgi:hypothetical protein